MEISELARNINTREDLICFIHALGKDLENNPDTWENPTLERFLEAIAAWMKSMDRYYINNDLPVPQKPTWRVVGEILMAAKMYE